MGAGDDSKIPAGCADGRRLCGGDELLVIDLRVPEGFDPKSAAELLQHLAHLWNQVLLYVVSFYVLSLRWIGMVQINPRGERVGQSFTRWAMVHLLRSPSCRSPP